MECKDCGATLVKGHRIKGYCRKCNCLRYYHETKVLKSPHGLSQQAIADKNGITQQAVQNMERKAFRKFRRNWRKEHGTWESDTTDIEMMTSDAREVTRVSKNVRLRYWMSQI